ncbi:MAG: aminotransferase class I/II-fold pyridoxal phosphate-dependent enzyme, partial [bacterium]
STEDNGFLLTPAQLEAAITPRTRWVFINSPCNPSGAVYSEKDFKALGEVLLSYPDVLVMSDDIYETIVFDNAKFVSFAQAVPELKNRTLTVNGLSKSHAMTGWRIGYGGGDTELIKAMTKIQGQSTLHPCSITQWAAVEALNGPQEILQQMSDTFAHRRSATMSRLDAINGLKCFPPQGAFYLFVSIKDQLGKTSSSGKLLSDDVEWVMALMEEQGVSVVPGSAFGTDGYFRLSFAASGDDLVQACERIKLFSEGLQ